MTAFKRILATTIVCALLLALSAPAWAESLTVYTGRDNAKVYNSSGEAVGALPANVKLTLKATRGSVCKVSYKGKTGYMKKSDLVKATSTEVEADTQSEATPVNKTVYAAKDGAKVRSKKGKTLAKLKINTEVTVTAVKGDVCQVKAGGKTGYMNKSDLSETRAEVPETTPEVTAAPQSVSKTAYAARNGAKVYNKKGKSIGKLSLNTEVTVTAVNGERCKVSVNGKTGYMKQSDLSESKVEEPRTSSQTAYVNKDGARVYNAKGKTVGSLELNTEVTVTATSGSLCKVKVGSRSGYMKAADLSSGKTETATEVVDIPNTTGYVSTDGAKVYDKNGRTVAQLALNTAVTVSAYSDDLVQVVNGAVTGYMKKSDVSSSKVEKQSLKYGDSGEAVKKVQRRLAELGYYTGAVGGNYQSMTQAAVAAFQQAAGLTADGVCNAKTLTALFSDSAPKKSQESTVVDVSTASAKSSATPAKGTAKEMDWWTSGIQKIFPRGATATITDVDTGLAWREQRRGGTNHADVQPLTAADTAALRQAYGGTWSWNRRAIFVTIDGENYAASMNGMPHGGGSITGNNFNGHHCVHFTNSRTHGSNKVCSLHQAAIQKAASTTLN